MGKDHRGKPAGSHRQERLGIKPVISSENLEDSEETREKYRKDEDYLADNTEQNHPNRNTKKRNSPNVKRHQ